MRYRTPFGAENRQISRNEVASRPDNEALGISSARLINGWYISKLSAPLGPHLFLSYRMEFMMASEASGNL
jgi:hypothetical protein